MAFDSAADLLFRISADTEAAQADLASLRTAISGTCADAAASGQAAGASLGGSLGGMHEGFTRVGSSTRETREALRGLGEEIGITMPRFVSAGLASLGPVSTVMAAAFAPIVVVGLIEVLAKVPAALQKGIDWLNGWDAAAKKAFEDSTRSALAWQTSVIGINERLRAIPLIGLEGTDLMHAKMAVNKQDLDEVAKKLDELRAKQSDLQEIAGVKPPGFVPGSIEQELEPGGTLRPKTPPPPAPSHEDVEKAKTQLKELDPVIKELADKYTDLTIKAKEYAAEAAQDSKKPLEDFTELSRILGEVQAKLAATGSAEDKVREEMAHLADEAGQAREKLLALNAAHKVSPEDYASQMAAWEYLAKMIPELQDRMFAEIDAKRSAELARQDAEDTASWAREVARIRAAAEKEGEALDSLRARLAGFNVQTLADKHAAADAEIERMREEYAEQNKLTGEASAEELAGLAKLRAEMHAKIDADAKLAADTELARLGEQLQRIEKSHQTTYDRIADQYQADVAKFSAAEEKKSLLAATSEAERAEISARFAAIRTALYTKEQNDLQTLKNSTGWQGVFGANFASQIKGNEALSKEWQDSTAQSHMLVRVAMESTKEQGQQFFGQEAEAMGGAIAQALVYSKSIGAAMKEATASTLESIAAKDMVLALDALGWGFYDLAMGNYADAVSAFEAAAIFGSVGAAAGAVGRAIAGPQSSAGSRAGAPGGSLPSNTSSRERDMQSGAVGAPAAASGPHVSITIMGHVIGQSGVSELCSMLNDAVLNGDNTLTATNTKTGVQVQQ
jgi:hypothetical protein